MCVSAVLRILIFLPTSQLFQAYNDYKIHFQETWDSPASITESIWLFPLWFCSTRWDQVLHRRTYAHCFPREFQQLRGIFVTKVRVPKSSNKEIVHIVELCPTVDCPLERTSEGNPGVKYENQVQNPTKNPFEKQHGRRCTLRSELCLFSSTMLTKGMNEWSRDLEDLEDSSKFSQRAGSLIRKTNGRVRHEEEQPIQTQTDHRPGVRRPSVATREQWLLCTSALTRYIWSVLLDGVAEAEWPAEDYQL